MKILDATTVIAICSEIDYPELLEKIGLLGHVLAIPSHIVESELLDKNTRKIMAKYVQSNKIQILKKNTVQEIREFQKDFPGLGMDDTEYPERRYIFCSTAQQGVAQVHKDDLLFLAPHVENQA